MPIDPSDQLRSEPEQMPVEVPLSAVSDGALENLIEAFILREGTDYGAYEVDLAVKSAQIRRGLASANIRIVFDPNTETVTLMTKQDWLAASKAKSGH